MTAVTEAKAQRVLSAIEGRYDVDATTHPSDRPQLVKNWEGDYSTVKWAIVWEGPEEWVYDVTGGGAVQAVKAPGLYLEPVNHYVIGIHPG
jgi:hypothetical protein